MMNILFVTPDNVNPHGGGIARVTYLLANGLAKKGIKSISAYLRRQHNLPPLNNVFEDEVYICDINHVKQYHDILSIHDIDFVLVQGGSAAMNHELTCLRIAINSQNRTIPLFFAFHSMPGYELYFFDWSILIRRIFSKAWREYIKQFFVQVVLLMGKSLLRKLLYKKYSIPYCIADKIILLSSTYEDDFNLLAQETEKSKYISIPNMLTYPIMEEFSFNKQKEVLIVARMDERSKRIKLALQIWEEISQQLLFGGWRLTIVGEGEDLEYYKHFVESEKINNVSFEGRKDPTAYYQRASIFMMTSSYEGWPMTLMEAMQNGCVPIVFDSFKAVHEIINNTNGIVVPNNKKDIYVERLQLLMTDDNLRGQLAQQAFVTCRRFDEKTIIEHWLKLFESYKI